jgi:hypothetical protein
MTGPDDTAASGPGDADEMLDELDLAILAEVGDMYGTADPPPPDLDTWVLFALALTDVEDEVARLREETLAGSGPRGALRTRTLAFEATDLEIMIAVTEISGGRARVDGWLVPPGAGRVELRLAGGQAGAAPAAGTPVVGTTVTRTARADASGRFVIDGVRHAVAQLRVLPAAPGASCVVTSAFAL